MSADRMARAGLRSGGFLAILAAVGMFAPAGLAGQTFQPTKVVEITKCNSFFGLLNQCNSIESERLGRAFTNQHLNRDLFSTTWGNASHCTQYSSNDQVCQQSVSAATDVGWDRVTWGTMGSFIASYGTSGTGVGQFSAPLGVDITRNEGQYHVVFVADAGNNRIVALSVGSTCKCVRWMGTIDGSESGKLLAMPHDVAWDHGNSWTLADDRLFITDTYNHRILVYGVSLDPVNATMSKNFAGAIGTEGSGTLQLRSPQGVTVRSVWAGRLLTYLAISDAGNHRVVTWFMDMGVTSQSGELALPGSDLVGITYDHAGDVIVADREYNRLIKTNNWGTVLLASYGNGSNAWASGSFNTPTDVQVVRAQRNVNGLLSELKLPYVATAEAWTATTGAQSHRLGVDVQNLSVTPGSCEATLSFVLTSEGSYSVSVRNGSGTTVRSWPSTTASSGWKSQYWNGKNSGGNTVPSGTYTFVVAHESGYTYDSGQPRYSQVPVSMNCFSVSASAPGYVTEKGTYWLTGAAPESGHSWKWEADFNGWGFSNWAYAQNSSFTVYDGENYDVMWRVSAQRSSDGVWGSGLAYTTVSVYCDPWGTDPSAVICPMSTDPDDPEGVSHDIAAARQNVGAREGEPLRPVAGQGRVNSHFGAGGWVGGLTQEGPRVAQLFSLFGTHDRAGEAWPNALAGTAETVQESREGRPPVRVTFSRQSVTELQESYRVRFAARQSGFRDGYVGIALDPDLGSSAQDDSLGFDREAGLVWVVDPDSGATGYVVTGRPAGTRLVVRQFSRRGEAERLDPASDSTAYREISARESVLTGPRDDVRFLIALGPVPLGTADVEVGLVVLRAPTLETLRRQAAEVAAREPALASASATGITRFQLAQAPPQPGAGPSVERVSLNLIPAFAEAREPGMLPPVEGLREQVRAHGITALAFAVPDGEAARIEIRIHDASGRLVRRLVESTYDPGAYRLQWDMRDEGGSRVGPGVYVAVMEAPGFRATTRLVVVR